MQQDQHTYQALWDIVNRLRSPGGCPWDREQTHQSLRRNLLEECYEALEALDAEDADGLAEELGDVMVQIVFHCQIAAENGTFTQADMFRHICEKLVRRHPHVFGDVTVRDAREVEANWEETKRRERGDDVSALDGVAKGMPALGYGQAVSYRAAQAGFEWERSVRRDGQGAGGAGRAGGGGGRAAAGGGAGRRAAGAGERRAVDGCGRGDGAAAGQRALLPAVHAHGVGGALARARAAGRLERTRSWRCGTRRSGRRLRRTSCRALRQAQHPHPNLPPLANGGCSGSAVIRPV